MASPNEGRLVQGTASAVPRIHASGTPMVAVAPRSNRGRRTTSGSSRDTGQRRPYKRLSRTRRSGPVSPKDLAALTTSVINLGNTAAASTDHGPILWTIGRTQNHVCTTRPTPRLALRRQELLRQRLSESLCLAQCLMSVPAVPLAPTSALVKLSSHSRLCLTDDRSGHCRGGGFGRCSA
jgi:hypothetical protein